ncbi:MAG: imelysin family protein, partial [Myxococcales bacterium]|nr:imelysin family protein [Myxococcales bacterium]
MVESWAAAPSSTSARQAAQQAWVETVLLWQEAELMQVGPAGSSGAVGRRTGGRDLRDEIYYWPFANPCRVDQELVRNQFEGEGFFDSALPNVYGLDALEYLLFSESTSSACPPQADILQNGGWAGLGEQLTQRRADFAAAVSVRLADDAERLRDAWTTGFRDGFVSAGQAGSPYRSAQAAIDEVFAAMYYIELRTIDLKLGAPPGLNQRCLRPTCPEQIESQYAGVARRAILRNMQGFAKMFFGGERSDPSAIGFDDYLTAAGAGPLAADMSARLEAAIVDNDMLRVTALTSGCADPRHSGCRHGGHVGGQGAQDRRARHHGPGRWPRGRGCR